MTGVLLPSATDWHVARATASVTDASVGRKRLVDLVPGDGFTVSHAAFVAVSWPEVADNGTVARILVGADPGSLRELEFVLDPAMERFVPSWPARTVNYGLARCRTCGCHVLRDHVADSADCRALVAERRDKDEW